MNKIKQAAQAFCSGYNCAQAVLSAYCGDYALDAELALKISSGFGAGMGRNCATCGAVTGAYMVIGLKYGYISPDDTQGKEKAYALVREFAKRFEERNGSTICEALLGTHMVTGDRELAARKIPKVCPKMVRDATEILESIL